MNYLIYRAKRIIKKVMFYNLLFMLVYLLLFNKEFLLTKTVITLSGAQLMAIALMMVR